MTLWAIRHICASVVIAVLLAGCGNGPDYPRDWPALQKHSVRINNQNCPDLSGTYLLPRSIHPRGARRKNDIVFLNDFLGVNAQHGRPALAPSKMTLEGPTADGLRVIFYDEGNRAVMDKTLKPESDFKCFGSWIGDAKPFHSRGNPYQYYAKDIENHLIGHKAFFAAGFVPLLDVIPLPVFVNDREWWRVDLAPPGAM